MTPRTRELRSGTVVRVTYHTNRQTYRLEGIVTDTTADAAGVMVSFENDACAPVTTARVYTTEDEWRDTRERCPGRPPIPNGYVQEALHDGDTSYQTRPAANSDRSRGDYRSVAR